MTNTSAALFMLHQASIQLSHLVASYQYGAVSFNARLIFDIVS
jgi:hypothetical protein